MSVTLKTYQKKRNFNSSLEPKAGAGKRQGKRLRFVLQRHHASRLHYDFRLEMKGVLKSWAVPKGPSLNPSDKRLAMMVEDHPYDYIRFEGAIPKGNYGAGTVYVLDRGTYNSTEENGVGEKALLRSLEEGNIKITLKGKILKGEFALVKMQNSDDNAWLLIKHHDKYAVSDKFNLEDLVPKEIKEEGIAFKKEHTEKSDQKTGKKRKKSPIPDQGTALINLQKLDGPMLATLQENLLEDPDWLYEQKLDGYRIMSIIDKAVILRTRNGINYNKKFPSIVQALKEVKHMAVLDGEVVAEDENGDHVFQTLQQHAEEIDYTLKYYIFDLLALNGYDLRELPLADRKELLVLLLDKVRHPQIALLPYSLEKSEKMIAKAKHMNWEGIIAKKIDSRYLSGKRSSLWRKLKIRSSQEAIIVGFTSPEGSRSYFGALVLAVYEEKQLIYIGNCGTGFKDVILQELYKEMKQIEVKKKPFNKNITVQKEKKVTWIKPKIICEVYYSEWTADGRLRHPVYKGLRPDKKKEMVKQEKPITGRENDITRKFGRKTLILTNQQKLYWPKDSISKGDLVDYYEQMATYILPYIKDRPLSLHRFPNGINKSGFFQKDLEIDQIPTWIKTTPIYAESVEKEIDYLVCNDVASLLWMVNLGCIEINPWMSTYRKQEQPVFAVLDIDPNGVDFTKVIQVALTAKGVLDSVEVKSYIKTSGSTGLHIFIHLGAKYDYTIAKNFIQLLAELVHEQHADGTSLERSPSKRKGKIYLDYLQNRKGQTIVCPYSVRPKPEAPVSAPLHWEEVSSDLDIRKFTLHNMPKRVTNENPWQAIFNQSVNLKTALNKLS
ncbi:DNA ligase D [Olivibacter sp. SDN3]|uniref:DNA ligase D n=1 Tax=Olivibacter sp. SDN3 TaxID=2764720 RepID=UPI001650FF82|nr:DNA ligase D [Olivibacter sp. SDN3]QNL49404.1 DNA ligase D [Olivibacter sp. SDN3]